MNLVNSINDSTLTENGIRQAVFASKEVEKLDIDVIYCSPLKRCVQTCGYININNIDVKYDDRLIERNSGSMQYKDVSFLDLNEWYDKGLDKLYSDTEGFKGVIDRVSNFLDEIIFKCKGKNVLLVTHGDVCKAIYVYFHPYVSNEDIILYNSGNCDITKYEI